MEDNTVKLYNALKGNGYSDLGTVDEFKKKLNDTNSRIKLYTALNNDGFSDTGTYDDFSAKLGYNPTLEKAEQTVKSASTLHKKGNNLWDWTKSFVQNVNSGADTTIGGLLGIMDRGAKNLSENIPGVTYGGLFKKAKDYLIKDSEKSQQYVRQHTDYDNNKSYTDYFKNGQIGKGIGKALLDSGQSLPISAAAAATTMAGSPMTGLSLIGLTSYDQQKEKLDKENPDMSEDQKIFNSLMYALSESGTEMLGDIPATKWLMSIYKKGGKDALRNTLKQTGDGILKRALKSNTSKGIATTTNEGLEEVINQFVENGVARITGEDPHRNMTDGLMDSFIGGVAGMAPFGVAAIPGTSNKMVNKVATRRSYNKAETEAKSALGDNATKYIDAIKKAPYEERAQFVNMANQMDTFNAKEKKALTNLVDARNKYDEWRTTPQEDSKELREVSIQSMLNEHDKKIAPIVNSNGNIQEAYIDDPNKPIFLTGGDVVITNDENGNPVFDKDKSSGTFYYTDENGKQQVVSSKEVNISNIIPSSEARNQYEQYLRSQFEAKDAFENQMQKAIETPEEYSNGDNVVYMDKDGNRKQGTVSDIMPNMDTAQIELPDGSTEIVDKSLLTKTDINQQAVTNNTQQNTTTEQPKEQPAEPETLDQLVPTLPKGKGGNVDFNKMDYQQAFKYTSLSDNKETAIADLKSDIDIKKKEVNGISKKISGSTGGKRLALREQLKNKQQELDDMNSFMSSVNPIVQSEQDDNTIKKSQNLAQNATITPVEDNNVSQIRPIDNSTGETIKLKEKKPRAARYAKEDAALGEPNSLKEDLLRNIATGAIKFKWGNSTSGTKGLGAHLGLSTKEMRKYIPFLNNSEGNYPEVAAQKYLENTDYHFGEYTDQDIFNEILDIMQSYNSPRKMIDDAIKMHGNNDLNKTEEEYYKQQEEEYYFKMAESYHMSVEDYRTYMEIEEQDIINRSEIDTDKEINGILAYELEEQKKKDKDEQSYNTGTDEVQGTNVKGNDLEGTEQESDKVRTPAEDNNTGGTSTGNEGRKNSGNTSDSKGRNALSSDRVQPYEPTTKEGRDRAKELDGQISNLKSQLEEDRKKYHEAENNFYSANGLFGSSVDEGMFTGTKDTSKENHDQTLKSHKDAIDASQRKLDEALENRDRLIKAVDDAVNKQTEIKLAEDNTETNPTDAQKEAGNYKKGHVPIDGLDYTIENPKGSIRSGKDSDGEVWHNEMKNTYGYILGTKGVDGDHIDMFISDNPTGGNVYVIDQIDPKTGKFDEHKVMYGFNNEQEASKAYLSNYSKGWKGLGTITEVSKDDFKKWIDSSTRKTKPFADYKNIPPKSVSVNGISETPKEFAKIKYMDGSTHVGEIISKNKDNVSIKSPSGRMYTVKKDKVLETSNSPIEEVLYREGIGDAKDKWLKNNDLDFLVDYAKEDIDKYHDYARAKNRLDLILRRYDASLNTGLSERRKKVAEMRDYLYSKFPDIEKHIAEQEERHRIAVGQMEASRKAEQERKAEIEKVRLEEEEKQKPYTLMSYDDLDKTYMNAVKSKDEEVMRRCINEVAMRKGYSDVESNYQGDGTWIAPNNGFDTTEERRSYIDKGNNTDVNIEDIAAGYSPQADDYFSNNRAYSRSEEHSVESARVINEAIEAVKRGEKPMVKVYRAVPTDIKESKVRNGDWVTPSKKYAEMHGNNRLEGKYRIIEQDVPFDELYWDGNDVNEWGFDDGSFYRYKNTKNNLKLNDLITRDDKGNIIPPSKRFNQMKNDIRFRVENNPELEKVNQEFNEELDKQIKGELHESHIYNLGYPSEALQSAGIPNIPIELSASQLKFKSSSGKHDYNLSEIKDLPRAISEPIATFAYGDRNKSQNILTVLEHNGENFIVGMFVRPTIKGKVLEINSIRNVFPKNNDSIIKWINQGKLTSVNKKKLLNFLDQQRTNYADVAFVLPDEQVKQENSEVSSATKIINEFQNPTLDEGKIVASVEDLSDKLNTSVRIVRNTDEITDIDKKTELEKRGSKGFYDVKTGEVTIVLPNAENIGDAEATVMHEVVAHKGLRGLLGDNFEPVMKNIYNSMPDYAKQDYSDNIVAAEEYCATMAENMVELGPIQKICSAFKEALRKIGINLHMSDGDIMYMLWKSKNRLMDNDTSFDAMNKIIADRKVKELTRVYDTVFRNKKPFDQLNIPEEKKEMLKSQIQSRSEQWQEAYIDRMVSVRKFQESLEKSGIKIPDYANVWMYENALSGKNTYEQEQLDRKLYKPLNAELKNLEKKGVTQRDIENYVMSKHGLERNDRMRMDTLKSYVDSIIERNNESIAVYKNQYSKTPSKGIENAIKRLENKNIELKGIISHDKIKDVPYSSYDNVNSLINNLMEKDFSGLTAIEQEVGDIKNYIDSFEKKMDTSELWDRIHAINNYSLKKWYDSGMINKDTYTKMKDMYKYYVPMRSFDKVVAHDLYDYYTEKDQTYQNIIKKANGRTSRADNPFAYMISMANTAVIGGNKNQMKLYLYRLAGLDNTGTLTIAKQWYVKTVDDNGEEGWKAAFPDYSEDAEQYRQNIEDFNIRMTELEKNGNAVQGKNKVNAGAKLLAGEEKEHIVRVLLNGEEKLVLVNGNPKIAQAVNGTNNVKLENNFNKGMSWLTRQMSANYTSRNPAFVMTNLSRDIIWSSTILRVKEGFLYRNHFIANIPHASAAITERLLKGDNWNPDGKYSKYYEEFLENGGRTGFAALNSIDKIKKDIELRTKSGVWNGIEKGGGALVDIMQLPNEWAEGISRLATYITSREEGRNILKSINDAKEVTVNFDRKGSGAKGSAFWGGYIMFFNAAIQGLNNIYAVGEKHPARLAGVVAEYAVMGMAIPFLLSIMGDDDDKDQYNNLSDYVRKNNICIPLKIFGGQGYLKIPLPIELRAIYGIGDAAYRYINGIDDLPTCLTQAVSGLMDLLPLNPSGDSGAYWPAFLKPIAESYVMNKDFTGKPIAKVTPFNEYDPEYTRIYNNTNIGFVRVSQFLNHLSGGDDVERGAIDKAASNVAPFSWLKVSIANPAAFEHLVESYFGGTFTTLNQAYKSVGAFFGTNEFEWRNVPVLYRFYDTGKFDGSMLKVNEKYYDYIKKSKELKHIYNGYQKKIEDLPSTEAAPYYAKQAKLENSKEWADVETIDTYSETIKEKEDELKSVTNPDEKKKERDAIGILKSEMVNKIEKGTKEGD